MMLLAALAAQQPSLHHVRTSEPAIGALIDAGLARSVTIRRLVDTLDQSDVIVYLEPKLTLQALGGFLAHGVVTAGGYRYLRISIETHGSRVHLVALLAHELQHAVEVSQEPDARDAESIERLFARLAVGFGCGSSTCTETRAALDVEAAATAEMKAAVPSASR